MIFLDTIDIPPSLHRSSNKERGFQSLAVYIKSADADVAARLAAILAHPQGKALLAVLFGHSPFLARLVLQHPAFFAQTCMHGVDAGFAGLKESLREWSAIPSGQLMKALRNLKSKTSLLIAIADIAGAWPLEQVTEAMSILAELCVDAALRHLFAQSEKKGDIACGAEGEYGLFALAMGKLGARELNYSSDIDLILFFDKDRVNYLGAQTLQHCFSKLGQELVTLLQERTRDGYVFRVDLRLRPDPASTPVALSTAGALTYYETVGQNWERAALIKARPIAGDIRAGYRFLKQLAPFLWRKHLDFAAIADIQSIKRQMDAGKGDQINLPGHNIKTGLGGIREIEFFAQIHQLIWGGRIAQIRAAATCETLMLLARHGLVEHALAASLVKSYRFLRMVEHRLQMVDDQQTHSIPLAPEARLELAGFAGFTDAALFENTLLNHLRFVHAAFSESFKGSGSLGSGEGKLSFTGVENDPQTLETLRKMGYRNPASVSEIIQGWHRGSRRATRTKRARELITELTPALLKALSGANEPDQAFIRFDEFLTKLPAGVQLFSLFYANPHLLDLLALIMGSAPAMAESLSKNPNLLDTVLTADFYHELPAYDALSGELAELLLQARDFEDEMEIVRRFRNERQFQAGVQLIRHQVAIGEVSRYLSDIAGVTLEALLHRVEMAFKLKWPGFTPGRLATVALGRLGARELTFGSDIDLVFVYDAPDHVLYNKLGRRFIGAVTALTREGRLYEVDTRLRPSGRDGALAVSIAAFDRYFRTSAWTFEFMALTRARVITGNPQLRAKLNRVIGSQLERKRKPDELARDVLALRARVTREFGSDDPWNVKYVRGGLMDMDFLAQYYVLLHAHETPAVVAASSGQVFRLLIERSLIDGGRGRELVEAHLFLNSLFALLRVCGGGKIDEAAAPAGLKHLIAVSLDAPDFATVKVRLLKTLALVSSHFEDVFTGD